MLGQRFAIDNVGRWHGDFVAIDVGIKPVGCRAAGSAEKLIKPAVNRSAGNRLRVIDPLHRLESVLGNRLSITIVKCQANMPLAKHGGRVPLSSEHGRYCEPVVLDEAWPSGTGEDTLHAVSKRHPAGEQAVARRGADGGGAVRVGEANALPGQAIDVRGGRLGFGVVTADIAVAEVVGEDEYDVGLGLMMIGHRLACPSGEQAKHRADE